MAVYAAHLTRTLSGSPSVFQVAAQEALGNTMKPALRKLVEYLAAVYPNKCSWLVDWYDELYLVFDCCLQYHYLKHYAASFSESFYGLVRVPTRASAEFWSGARLPAPAERASLALLVLLPYARDKCERAALRWREQHEDGTLGKGSGGRLRVAALRVYSAVHVASSCARAVQLCRYLTGRAASATPALAALSLALRDAPAASRPADTHTWADLATSLLAGRLGSAVVTFPMVGGAALRCVEYGAFLVQFLRWWERRPHAAAPALPPPPPPPPQRAEAGAGGGRGRNKCPLCLQTWRAPTVLPTSGLVFCYACISRHLRAHRACPVTRYPATEESLIRMYVDD